MELSMKFSSSPRGTVILAYRRPRVRQLKPPYPGFVHPTLRFYRERERERGPRPFLASQRRALPLSNSRGCDGKSGRGGRELDEIRRRWNKRGIGTLKSGGGGQELIKTAVNESAGILRFVSRCCFGSEVDCFGLTWVKHSAPRNCQTIALRLMLFFFHFSKYLTRFANNVCWQLESNRKRWRFRFDFVSRGGGFRWTSEDLLDTFWRSNRMYKYVL